MYNIFLFFVIKCLVSNKDLVILNTIKYKARKSSWIVIRFFDFRKTASALSLNASASRKNDSTTRIIYFQKLDETGAKKSDAMLFGAKFPGKFPYITPDP